MSETTQIAPDTRKRSTATRSRHAKSFVPRNNGHKRLTDRQEKFVTLVASGMTASDAYRATYTTASMKPQTVWTTACMLMQSPKVAERYAQLKRVEQDKNNLVAALNRDWVLGRLMRNARVALGEDRLKIAKAVKGEVVEVEVSVVDQSAANRALELLGKELRMFRDQVEVGGVGEFDAMTDDELRRYVAAGAKLIEHQGETVAELPKDHAKVADFP